MAELSEHQEALQALLKVEPSEVTDLLAELEFYNGNSPSEFERSIPVDCYYVRFQNGLPRVSHLASKLCDHIVHFCLNRDRLDEFSSVDIRQLYLQAKRKFANPRDGRTGEPGELLLYFLLEGQLNVPKVFTKMSLKTNNQMHVHGSDGVHLGITEKGLILYFGESKLYGSCSRAVADAVDSVESFVSPPSKDTNYTQEDFEINVLSNHLDIPEGALREQVLDALDPYSQIRSSLSYVYACFIGFDLAELNERCETSTFTKLYADRVRRCYQAVQRRVINNPSLASLSWHFFFIPFGSVEEFRKAFLKELNE